MSYECRSKRSTLRATSTSIKFESSMTRVGGGEYKIRRNSDSLVVLVNLDHQHHDFYHDISKETMAKTYYDNIYGIVVVVLVASMLLSQ